MKLYQHTQKGLYHADHNEDFLVSEKLNGQIHAIAVMDGCSAGRESYFASTLIGKILRKAINEIAYKAFAEKRKLNIKQLIGKIMELLFLELKELKNKLMLNKYELLSTIIIGVVDAEAKTAEVLTVGDGLVSCNGELFEYDQNNKPDYLGYHLDMTFKDWYDQQSQRLSLENVKDLSIATDGILSFQNVKEEKTKNTEIKRPIEYLLNNLEYNKEEYMLRKKIMNMGKDGIKPMDDVAIIRCLLE